jgi:glucosamine 6-phosphate synthetase-like amidotransferase/phosphosugar isomerase protein
MNTEDKDWLMRQVRAFATGLGALLSKDSLRDFLEYKHYDSAIITDDDLDALIVYAQFQRLAEAGQLSAADLAAASGIAADRLAAFTKGTALPTTAEQRQMQEFLDHAAE